MSEAGGAVLGTAETPDGTGKLNSVLVQSVGDAARTIKTPKPGYCQTPRGTPVAAALCRHASAGSSVWNLVSWPM